MNLPKPVEYKYIEWRKMFERPAAPEVRVCNHLNNRVYRHNKPAYATCLDCGKEANLSEVFTNWII